MRNFSLSGYACFVIIAIMVVFRCGHLHDHSDKTLRVTTWDAFGYYVYLPSAFIYNDMRELNWVEEADRKYDLTEGELYQASLQKDGKYVFKYLGGVAIMQAPFFFIGHTIAIITGAPADGFSWPYQYSIAFGAILWVTLGLILLRKILLRFFDDRVTAITLLLVFLASNLLQYVSVDGAMSHAWIFPLYVFVLYTTIKWHERPSAKWAFLTALIIGLATISRPTELIMFFIPLFWNTHTKETAKAKWQLVKEHKRHLLFVFLGGLIGVLPQLIYWKFASGSFVYDVGSKWYFLNPWFRVLFGFEKGWFIYTPVALLMVAGFFFMKNFPFRKSVIIFCLLNIWIIIAWSDWQYGASYSCRAMTQSYPVFALSLGALISRINRKWMKISFAALAIYLIGVNQFQLWQYGVGTLHYREMNFKYYAKIYLDPHPSALEFSLLDNPDYLNDEEDYVAETLFTSASADTISCSASRARVIASVDLKPGMNWIKAECSVKSAVGHNTASLRVNLIGKDSLIKTGFTRLYYPTSVPGEWNEHGLYIEIPSGSNPVRAEVLIESFGEMRGEAREIQLTGFYDLNK